MKINTCFHHEKDKCQGGVSKAHSIQMEGRLSIIEGEVNGNNRVYTFTSFKECERSVIEDLVPIGKKNASTFWGFCKFHDVKLFSEIENTEFNNSYKHYFLHSYRSFAHSYHRKKEEIQGYENIIKTQPEAPIQDLLKGAKMGLNDMDSHKRSLDRMIENEIYDELEYLVYEKEGLFPFAVSSLMSPNVSYNNFPMNNHADPEKPFSQPIITFLPDKKTTFVIVAAFPDDKKSVRLLNELSKLSDNRLEKAITSLIIANCENTFFSPLFWDSLTKEEKRMLLDEFLVNQLTTNYINRFFISKFNFFDPKYEIKKLIRTST